MQKKGYLIFVFSLIFIILLSSIKTTLDSFYNYYRDYKQNTITLYLDNIYRYKPLNIFNSYTGFETGYGFFGTNVSSDFVIAYELYDSKGKNMGKHRFKLNGKEGSLRFSSINKLFLDQLTNKNDDIYNKYIGIVMKEIASFIYKKYEGKYSVHLMVYLYHFPSLKEYSKGKNKTDLFLLNEITYKQ